MQECSLTAGCLFFNDKMANMPSMSAMYKTRYCGGDHATCARFRVFAALGRENVPTDLFPNDVSRAELVIAG